MKKLLCVLFVLLLTLPALAEDVIGGADAATDIAVAQENLMLDGLLVTVVGLGGVFLVLILFFLMIKVMGKLLK